MIKFEHIDFLYLLGILPILGIALLFFNRWKKEKLKLLSTENLHTNLYKNKSSSNVSAIIEEEEKAKKKQLTHIRVKNSISNSLLLVNKLFNKELSP